MSLLLITGAAIAVLTAAIYWFLTGNNSYWKKRSVIGPKPDFFYGNIKDLVQRKIPLNFAFVRFYEEYPKEKFVGILRLRSPCLVIRDLDMIKNIMIKDFDHFVDRGQELNEKGLGLNIFSSSSDTWNVLRNKFTPTFTSGKMKGMYYLVNDRGDNFAKHVDGLLNQEVEIYSLLQKYTKTVISSCAFGLDLDLSDKEMFDKLTEMDKKTLRNSYFNELNWMFPGILKLLQIDIVPKSVFNFFIQLVRDIFEQRKGLPSNRKDFMDLIFEMKNKGEAQGARRFETDKGKAIKIDDVLIAANVFVFYIAGFETSASTMSFMLHELAYHPELQDRLVEEINEVLARHNGELVYEALAEMTYLKQVFDETLRKYPVVDPLNRVAKSDYAIPDSDLVIEKGVQIVVPVRAIHYDESIYPDPYKFDPERFSPENAKSRHAAAYLPFGIGPRNCIGMRFGQVTSRVCIAKLLPKFRVVPGPTSRYDFIYDNDSPLLRVKDGVPLQLLPRN